jgi:predicted O-methyltransferase YrrM
MATYTNNWFEITGIKNFEKYVPKEGMFLEVGCYEGRASNWIMENTKANLVVVDTFKGGQDLPDETGLIQRFKDNVEKYIDQRIRICVGKSQEVLRKSPFDYFDFDFIYIDGSHLACDTLEDAVLAFRLLKNGGIMIFDDYTWGANLPPLERPCVGIDAFINVFADQLEVLEKNSQMIIKKH